MDFGKLSPPPPPPPPGPEELEALRRFEMKMDGEEEEHKEGEEGLSDNRSTDTSGRKLVTKKKIKRSEIAKALRKSEPNSDPQFSPLPIRSLVDTKPSLPLLSERMSKVSSDKGEEQLPEVPVLVPELSVDFGLTIDDDENEIPPPPPPLSSLEDDKSEPFDENVKEFNEGDIISEEVPPPPQSSPPPPSPRQEKEESFPASPAVFPEGSVFLQEIPPASLKPPAKSSEELVRYALPKELIEAIHSWRSLVFLNKMKSIKEREHDDQEQIADEGLETSGNLVPAPRKDGEAKLVRRNSKLGKLRRLSFKGQNSSKRMEFNLDISEGVNNEEEEEVSPAKFEEVCEEERKERVFRKEIENVLIARTQHEIGCLRTYVDFYRRVTDDERVERLLSSSQKSFPGLMELVCKPQEETSSQTHPIHRLEKEIDEIYSDIEEIEGRKTETLMQQTKLDEEIEALQARLKQEQEELEETELSDECIIQNKLEKLQSMCELEQEVQASSIEKLAQNKKSLEDIMVKISKKWNERMEDFVQNEIKIAAATMKREFRSQMKQIEIKMHSYTSETKLRCKEALEKSRRAATRRFRKEFDLILAKLKRRINAAERDFEQAKAEETAREKELTLIRKQQKKYGQVETMERAAVILETERSKLVEGRQKKLETLMRQLDEKWKSLETTGAVSAECIQKHRLLTIQKVEDALPLKATILTAYRTTYAAMQEALPIFEALEERTRLHESIDSCNLFLKGFSPEEIRQSGEARDMLRMLNRDMDALTRLNNVLASMVEEWERNHQTKFVF